MIKKLIELIYPNTHDPKDFALKSVPYAGVYRAIAYTANGGKTFRKIFKAEPPLFALRGVNSFNCNLDWQLEPLTYNLENDSLSTFRVKFHSYAAIQTYEEEQFYLLKDKRADWNKSRQAYFKKLKENSL